MFVDLVKIYVKAGDGGRGCVSFRREMYVPKGGPDGGDGGKGGNVIVKANPQLNTLLDHRYQQHYYCKDGNDGGGKQKSGHESADVIVWVPVGTLIRDLDTGEVLGDLTEPGQEAIVARGGRGGKGNTFFKTSTNQAPRHAQPGEPGDEKTIQLELKLLADVGLIGLPNAGKSTLISVITSARPKIADYPFTTLVPNLGVVKLANYKSFVVADIPGLIEGASSGAGLGSQFLRHVERTKMLLHLVDVSSLSVEEPVKSFDTINEELRLHNPELMEREMVAVATKIDSLEEPERLENLREHCREVGVPFFAVSSATHDGIDDLLAFVSEKLEKMKAEEAEAKAEADAIAARERRMSEAAAETAPASE
ncbi:MAG: GTPase ObgE [Nitrospirae bacterium]|nr:GTPase ObgE [Nitrospirota bacterium]MBI5696831.1 GTPase ObgE [Nitrospirota bacterium]